MPPLAQRIAPTVLVLFGPSGTGKSHLAYGLVRHWQAKLGDASAIYTTAADFRHLLNDAIKRQAEPEFRADFRSRRLLAIDDLQHMPADDFAWQELRFLLDDYEDRGATVIITASESISTLPNIPSDIRSRLAAGLSLQLAPPGGEARTRIVQHAAHALGRPLADDVIQRLAHGINGTASTLFSALFELLSPANAKLASDAVRTNELLASRNAKTTDDPPDFGRRRSAPKHSAGAAKKRFPSAIDRLRSRLGRLPRPRARRSQLRRDRPGSWRSRPHHDHSQLPQDRRGAHDAPTNTTNTGNPPAHFTQPLETNPIAFVENLLMPCRQRPRIETISTPNTTTADNGCRTPTHIQHATNIWATAFPQLLNRLKPNADYSFDRQSMSNRHFQPTQNNYHKELNNYL